MNSKHPKESFNSIGEIYRPTDDEKRRAAKCVIHNARDEEDAKLLLSVLGLEIGSDTAKPIE